MSQPAVGKRIKLLGPMVNKNSAKIPVEEGMLKDLEGTIVHINFNGPPEYHQISVNWDNGRTLAILPYVDEFIVLDYADVPTKHEGDA
jgi:hypothetical protein